MGHDTFTIRRSCFAWSTQDRRLANGRLPQTNRLNERSAEAHIVSAQEEERRHIARELHDGIGQSLTAVLVGLCALEQAPMSEAIRAQASALRRITVTAVEEVRRLARGLRARLLDDLGLPAALLHYAADCSETYGFAVEVSTSDLAERRLPATLEIALYRIVQEAVSNAVRHGAAKRIRILIQRQFDRVCLSVQDNGSGFDVDAIQGRHDAHEHLGLSGMRERAALLNGSLSIESRPGLGTTVSVSIPVPEANHGEDSGTDCR
jgi:signal transduction histidine kinase